MWPTAFAHAPPLHSHTLAAPSWRVCGLRQRDSNLDLVRVDKFHSLLRHVRWGVRQQQKSEASPTGDQGEHGGEEDSPRDSCNSPVMQVGADTRKGTMPGICPLSRAGVIFDSQQSVGLHEYRTRTRSVSVVCLGTRGRVVKEQPSTSYTAKPCKKHSDADRELCQRDFSRPKLTDGNVLVGVESKNMHLGPNLTVQAYREFATVTTTSSTCILTAALL